MVVADVPCSGLGIIRKKPDIRYKNPRELAQLPAIQADILENAAGYVRPGGVLVYSTCTVLPEENQDVIHGFSARAPGVRDGRPSPCRGPWACVTGQADPVAAAAAAPTAFTSAECGGMRPL